jgi:transposase
VCTPTSVFALRERNNANRGVGGSSDSLARPTTAVGFEVLPKRWIVERTFAWINRFRRLARDFERYARTVAAFIRLSMIRIMLRRLVANPSS